MFPKMCIRDRYIVVAVIAPIVSLNLVWLIADTPVSYTHLDVYKRQEKHLIICVLGQRTVTVKKH